MPKTTAPALPKFPFEYVPSSFDAGDWTRLEACFDELETRTVRGSKELDRWLLDFSELAAVTSQEEARRYIDMTCHTDDADLEDRYLSYQRDIVPKLKPRWQALKQRYLDLPARRKLPKKRYAVLDRLVANEVRLFRAENVPLETRDTELAQQYQKIMGAMTVTYEGREHTIQQMGRYLEVQDPKVRRNAWERISRRVLQDRDAIDAVYDELVEVRDHVAHNAGFENFRDYAFPMRNRFDYGPKECLEYHAAVEAVVVPELKKLHVWRRKRLKQPSLRPWDLGVDPLGGAPLRPFQTAEQLFQGVREIYRRVSPDLAALFQAIWDQKLVDLESRKGKAPGGYNCPLEADRMPFIFMNAAGLHRDVQTLLHEGGHAFHTLLSRDEPLVAYRNAPLEFAEVASQGMEMIGLDHMEVFYSKDDADRGRRKHFEDIVSMLAWIAQIDAFQHWVYTDPKHSRVDRRRAWIDLRLRLVGNVDWEGLDEAHESLWHRQPHLFSSPFYYIEYAISLIGALQLWLHARKDRAAAVRKYRRALSLGGSRPLPELFHAAGLKFDFGERILAPLVKAVMKELNRLA
ncbi:MAG: M3 family oligoendopeptidase [Planctomycetes bacterium]|nr:M3 family oligoendopeptidase [Planctomycetota bacterium]